MNKKDLVEAVAFQLKLDNYHVTNTAVAITIDHVMDQIMEAVASGDKVILAGFGVFHPRQRAARGARNPRTGEAVPVPARTVPFFKSGTEFKRRVK